MDERTHDDTGIHDDRGVYHHKHEHESDHGHTHDFTDRLDRLDDSGQFRYLSGEELRTYLDPRPDDAVADLGSGTGFYTDEVAPVTGTVYAVDAYEEMHERYRSNGMPTNVTPLTASVSDVPLADGTLDGAISIRTFHHGVADALEEVGRLLAPGGRLVVVDWSATGAGERDRGPNPSDCFDVAEVQSMLIGARFHVRVARERRETFVVVATRGRN